MRDQKKEIMISEENQEREDVVYQQNLEERVTVVRRLE